VNSFTLAVGQVEIALLEKYVVERNARR